MVKGMPPPHNVAALHTVGPIQMNIHLLLPTHPPLLCPKYRYIGVPGRALSWPVPDPGLVCDAGGRGTPRAGPVMARHITPLRPACLRHAGPVPGAPVV